MKYWAERLLAFISGLKKSEIREFFSNKSNKIGGLDAFRPDPSVCQP